MSMFLHFPLCRLFAALVFFGAFALAVQAQSQATADVRIAPPVVERAEVLPEKDEKDEVVLSLAFNFGHPLRGRTREGNFVPQLVVWKDGRVLYGKFNPTPERPLIDYSENWTYSWGKIDPEKVEELVKLFQKDFSFGKDGGTIFDTGPSAGYWTLYGIVDDKIHRVSTWEQFNNLNSPSRANSGVGSLVDGITAEYRTADGKPLTLREFYDLWRQIKGDVIKWGEAVTKENPITVQVIVEDSKMTVKDKDGKVLVYVSSLYRR